MSSQSAIDRELYLKEMERLLDIRVVKDIDSQKSISIGFTIKGNCHLYSDTFGRARDLEKEDLKNLDAALENANFVKSVVVTENRKDNIVKFFYFKDSAKELYYNVAEKRVKLSSGKETIHRFLYSVTSKIK